MGKVLVDYSGMPVCRHFTDNKALAKRICTAVFDSPEWVLLDMGVIKEKDGIEKMISVWIQRKKKNWLLNALTTGMSIT